MIKRDTLLLRLDWAPGQIGTDKAEGKFVTISEDGKTASQITSASTKPNAVVVETDGRDGARGNGCVVALFGLSGVVTARCIATPGLIKFDSPLAMTADGSVKLAANTAGEITVARSVQIVSGTASRLIEVVLLPTPVVKA